MVGDIRSRLVRRMRGWGQEGIDALLYGGSAIFAGVTALVSTLSLYRVWGEMAVGPYVAAAVISAAVGRHRVRASVEECDRPPGSSHRSNTVRVWLFILVLFGATLAPLSLEVALTGRGNPPAHVQPEVVVIEQAAGRLAHGKDPYHAVVSHGNVVSAVPGEPTYESFFPYLPLMMVFGLPRSTHGPVELTDARVFFSVVTLIVVVAALALCRGPRDSKVRVLQFLTVLPTAALPLATGGDDMPIVAFLLLAMVLAQRRRPGWSGLVLGAVSAMKFTAWPLAVLALFAARDGQGRRAPGRMTLGMLAVAGPIVVPFVLQNPHAFFVNVVLFPLGLSGIPSPAASALPGHILVTLFPSLHRVLPAAVALVAGFFFVRYLVRHTPSTPAGATALAGWAMLVAILFAPATRVGYLLYPIDFFTWYYMLRDADRAMVPARPVDQVLAAAR